MHRPLSRKDRPRVLPLVHVGRWRAMEEIFRKQIVKSAPRGKRIGGVELPFDGYEPIDLAVGAICDGCASVLEPGCTVRYHVRTGRAYCPACTSGRDPHAPAVAQEGS